MKEKNSDKKQSKDLGDPRASRELTDRRGGTEIEKKEKGDVHRPTKRKNK